MSAVRVILACGVLLVGLLGCRAPHAIETADYAQLLQDIQAAKVSGNRLDRAIPPEQSGLAGPQPVDVFIKYALARNPEIQAARKQVDVAAYRVPQAASLPDPNLGVTVGMSPVQTAAGEQNLILSLNQRFPWPGKLAIQAAATEAAVDVARAQLAAVERKVIEQVKHTYYELYYLQQAVRITQESRALLEQYVEIAETRYQAGTTTQQDVLRAQVELLRLDEELVRLRQRLQSAQARMASLIHVSPDTPLLALDVPPVESVPENLQELYSRAVSARPELHALLAAIESQRYKVELAHLAYLPDVTAGVSWLATSKSGLSPVADGEDPVLLAMSVNVPIYRKRLRAAVREAESQAVASARQYDSLRDQTLETVKSLYVQAVSHLELIKLYRDDIIPKAKQTLEVSQAGYQAGQVDFLQLIDNWQQLLRFQLVYYRLESQLQQTLASLERIVGGQLLEPLDSAIDKEVLQDS